MERAMSDVIRYRVIHHHAERVCTNIRVCVREEPVLAESRETSTYTGHREILS